MGEVELVVAGDEWDFVSFEEDPAVGLTASAPEGWLTKSDSAEWTTDYAPLSAGIFGYNHFSAFCRKTFTVTRLSEIKELTMEIIYDENPTVYLNGEVIWSAEGYHDQGYVTVDLTDKLSLLKEGENTICVSFSNVLGGSTMDLVLKASDTVKLFTEEGYVIAGSATCQGFMSFGAINDPMNVTDGDQSSVCGSGWNADVEQSITVTFKAGIKVTNIQLWCKNEGTTSHEDGFTRGTYDVYLINGETETKVNTEPVSARTIDDGGASIDLEGVEATGIKVVITSWQGTNWACLADVMVMGEAIA
jgi:hypothetical protein